MYNRRHEVGAKKRNIEHLNNCHRIVRHLDIVDILHFQFSLIANLLPLEFNRWVT